MSHVLKWNAETLSCSAIDRTCGRGRKLNILMLAPTSFFSDYGCHVRILEEARTMVRRGHQIRIFTYHQGRDLPHLDIARSPSVPWGSRYSMGSSWHKLLFDAILFWRTYRAQRAQPPDLVHAFLHEGALVGSALSRLWRVPLVFDYQGSLTGEMADHGFLRPDGAVFRGLRRMEQAINNLPQAVITSSAHAARLLRESFACRCPIIRTVPDCVDAQRFRRPESSRIAALRRHLGLPHDRRLVGYLGKLAGYQGTEVLLEAAARLHTRQPDLHFLIMGYPDEDLYREQAARLGLTDASTFTGRIRYEDAAEYLALLDVAVAPKLSETESNGKLLNYMALGIPTVAFDTPVAREYLGPLGHLAAPTAADLALTIEHALDAPDRDALGRRLRERAVSQYSWEQAGEHIEQVYRQVLDKAEATVPATDGPDW